MRTHASALGLRDGFEEREWIECFSDRLRRNLRIVMSFSCTADKAKRRISGNPVLLEKCWIKQLEPWKKETLTEMAHVHASKDLHFVFPEKQDQLIKAMLQIHSHSQHRPGRLFLDFVNLTCLRATQKKAELDERIDFIQVK